MKGFSHDSEELWINTRRREGRGEEDNIKGRDFVIYFDHESILAVNYLQVFEFELRSHTMRAWKILERRSGAYLEAVCQFRVMFSRTSVVLLAFFWNLSNFAVGYIKINSTFLKPAIYPLCFPCVLWSCHYTQGCNLYMGMGHSLTITSAIFISTTLGIEQIHWWRLYSFKPL